MGDLITVAAAARELGVERQTAYRYVKEGRLPTVTIAGRQFVDSDVLGSVEVKPKGWKPNENDQREWTPAMTVKRAEDWNDALESGRFADPKTGKIDDGLIAAYELEVGYTHADILAALARHGMLEG